MLRHRLLGWALSLVLLVAAQDYYDFGVNTESLARRHTPGAPIVVGRLPLAANGTIPLRVELREMKRDRYKWDLFILALSKLQSTSQDDPLSWYQIAGIHGVPFVTWNGVEPVPGASQSGYCTHSSVLFPMWHRPYLALYEQEVFRLVNAIARMFGNVTERTLYQKAASDFRIPYWDWASPAPQGDSFFPSVLWDPAVSQYGPNGAQAIRNPLYSYAFHPLDSQAFIWDPLKQWNETKRAPDMAVSVESPPSMNDQVDTALRAKLPEIQQRLYALFSNYHDFNAFGNKVWSVSQNLSTLDSIEAVHDIIHIYGGSRGHMTYVPLSSFDPLFFLHHVMTDRLIAMWQLLNPTAWITPMAAGETSYTSLKGTVQDSRTPLTPFMASADGSFWTSDMSRSTEMFGYAYADTGMPHGDFKTRREKLIRKINKWLGASSAAGLARRPPHWRPQEPGQAWVDEGGVALRPNVKPDAKDPPASKIIRGGRYTEWVANAHVSSEEVGGSFTVHLFIGEPPESREQWNGARNLAGSVGFFAMKMQGSEGRISGAVPLTTALIKMIGWGALDSLEAESVVPFLQGQLRIRVERVGEWGGMGVDVCISSSSVRIPRHDAELPEWGEQVERMCVRVYE